METRAASLGAFYLDSPAWLNHRDAANATIIDSDNVLLLRPARSGSGFNLAGLHRAKTSREVASASFVGAAVLLLNAPADEPFIESFESSLLPKLKSKARRMSYLVTEQRPNDFPRLPVRENERAFVVTGICAGRADLDEWLSVFAEHTVPGAIRERLIKSEHLRLEPASRSLFR